MVVYRLDRDMAESSVNVQVLSNALNLFTNAIQAATTLNRSSVNITIVCLDSACTCTGADPGKMKGGG